MVLAPLLLTITFIPFPALARPVAPSTLAARQNASASMNYDVIFDIAFPLALFILLLGSFARLASLWTAGVQPGEFFSRLCAACSRQLSAFGHSTFIESTAATFLDVNSARVAFVPRRGGATYPVATVPGGMQAGGPRRVGVVQGSGGRPAGVPSSHAIV
ncbi:hypothetical protein V8E53_012000 [Lactarius tabidus]